MLTKQDVYDFLDLQRDKAYDKVSEKHDKLIEEAVKKYLTDNPGIKENLERLTEISKEGFELQNTVNKLIGLSLYSFNKCDFIKAVFINRRNTPSGEVTQARAEKDFEINKVRIEYSRLKDQIKKKRSGDKAKDYLKELGFDVSSLEQSANLPAIIKQQEVKFDKSALFPSNK